MRASGTTGWCWTGKKAARQGSASEAMPGYYKKTRSGEVTELRAGGVAGWCWTGKKAGQQGRRAKRCRRRCHEKKFFVHRAFSCVNVLTHEQMFGMLLSC